MVTSTLEPLISFYGADGVLKKIRREFKKPVNVAKWNKELDICASGGVEKKIIVSLNLTLLVVG